MEGIAKHSDLNSLLLVVHLVIPFLLVGFQSRKMSARSSVKKCLDGGVT